MVEQSFRAFDNESLLIDGTSPFGTPGNPIINNSNTPDGTIFTFQENFTSVGITIDDLGGNPDVFEDGDPGNHTVTDGGGIVANGTGVESESILTLQQIDAGGNPVGDPITITIYSQNGNFSDVWGFGTDTPLIPGARYVKASGINAGASEYDTFVCFVSGTLIATPDSLVPVEMLRPGDLVLTRDHGARPLRWTGQREVVPTGAMAPVRIEAGALGNDRDLVVSQQHRIHLNDVRAGLMFDSCDVLVPAKSLIGKVPGIYLDLTYWRVTYCHIMFDRHELIWSEGMLTESFHPGAAALKGIAADARTELLTLFPELANADETRPLACRTLSAFETRALMQQVPFFSESAVRANDDTGSRTEPVRAVSHPEQ